MLQKTSDNEQKQEEEDTPLFSIGLIADPQYADSDNGQNYTKTRTRRYRQALTITENAVKTWNDDKECLIRPSLIMNLGDVIDLRNVKSKASVKAMNTIMVEFDKFKPYNPQQLMQNMNINISKPEIQTNEEKGVESEENDTDTAVPFGATAKYPFYHNCLGNHELYNFNRKELSKYQHCSSYNEQNDEYQYYYSFYPYKGYLFIVLDAFVLSVHGYEYCGNKHEYFNIATDLLQKHNANENKNIPPTATDKTEVDVQRYTAFNGGFGEKQLKWLTDQLEIANENDDKVFIFSHVPLVSTNKKAPWEILAWDYKECKEIIDKYKSVVKTFFAGHDHDGDKKLNGIVHRTFEGAIEAAENKDCFAIGYFYANRLAIKGYGIIKDEVYPF